MALGLEQMAYDNGSNVKPSNPASCYDFESDQSKNELVHSLAELYSLLCEEDMWAGVWQKHAHYKETGIAVAYEQHGFFEQAQAAYEAAMNKYKQDTNAGPVPAHTQREVLLWNQQWIRYVIVLNNQLIVVIFIDCLDFSCAKELNQWEIIVEYAKNPLFYDALLLLDSAWRTTMPNWDLMKEALSCVEYSCPKELGWKVTMYGGFLLICQPDETKPLKFVERYVETASALCLNEWRRLPTIVSHIHLPYLQAAQQIMELHEAFQIHKGLTQRHQTSVHDMKAIVKTWRNRLPVIADDLTHWNDIFTWRQLHYQVVVSHFESVTESNTANSMLGVHASAQVFLILTLLSLMLY